METILLPPDERSSCCAQSIDYCESLVLGETCCCGNALVRSPIFKVQYCLSFDFVSFFRSRNRFTPHFSNTNGKAHIVKSRLEAMRLWFQRRSFSHLNFCNYRSFSFWNTTPASWQQSDMTSRQKAVPNGKVYRQIFDAEVHLCFFFAFPYLDFVTIQLWHGPLF